MELSFFGAARAVTGSCHYIKAAGKNILIDCGLQQGQEELNMQDLPCPANQIDYVLLTHAHIDHSGRLPLLAKNGFCGKVYTTVASTHLCEIMLRDSAHIQEFEAEWRNRKGKRSGKLFNEPLYSMKDAEQILTAFVPCPYNTEIELTENIKVRFIDVGHLLGSASIEIWVTEENECKKIVFSGDVGNINKPLINDPKVIDSADYIVIESTYGDKLHNAPPDSAKELAQVIQRTFDRGGNVIIPSFAIGRTQEMLYYFRRIKEENLVTGHGNFDVYVDSPLANEATSIFNRDGIDCFDEESIDMLKRGINPISFDGLHTSVSTDDSIAINFIHTPKVIISASGMCEAGRIKHHLKHNLWREECSIIFVGYQAVGTLGRAIKDGAKRVKIFGEEIEIKAEIVNLDGISGHADQKELLYWLDAFNNTPKHIFIVHGEESVCEKFSEMVKQRYKCNVSAPYYSEVYDLLKDEMIKAGVKQERTVKARSQEDTAYGKLVIMGKRLQSVIEKNFGGTNKDMGQFLSQLQSLCDKWDR